MEHAEPVRRNHRQGDHDRGRVTGSRVVHEHHFGDAGYLPSGCRGRAQSPRAPEHGVYRATSACCRSIIGAAALKTSRYSTYQQRPDQRSVSGMGYAPHEIPRLALPISRRVSLNGRKHEVLRHCFTARSSVHGKRYDRDVVLRPRYVQPGGPPMWIAARIANKLTQFSTRTRAPPAGCGQTRGKARFSRHGWSAMSKLA